MDTTGGPRAPEASPNSSDGGSLFFFFYLVHVFAWMHASLQMTGVMNVSFRSLDMNWSGESLPESTKGWWIHAC